MIPCLRVDLIEGLDPNIFPSRALWSEDNPDRPANQRGRKLRLDPVTLVVWSDDIDLISPSQWARVRISAPEPELPAEAEMVVAEWQCLCELCGRGFASIKARDGHKRHCKGKK